MKAIIIEEKRFIECAEMFLLEKYKLNDSNTPERVGIDRGIWQSAIQEAHRAFHYTFTRWAQRQGVEFTK